MELLSPAGLVVAVPLLAAILLVFVAHREAAGWLNFAAAVATFALACRLPWEFGAGQLFLVDAPAAHMAILAAFVGMGGAWFGRTRSAARLYYPLFQVLLGFSLLALLANGPGATWICIEATVIAAAVAIGLPLTPEAVAAAWRFLIVSSVGLALALFGVVALSVGGTLQNLGFMLLLGYGTISMLAPVQAGLPGTMQLAPLLAILRASALAPGPALPAFGLAALLFAAFCLWQQEPRWRAAFSGIGQTGVVLFAFGLGSAAAVFAGLLHLTLLNLTRTVLAQCEGRRRGVTGIAAVAAMAGLPPFGLFSSLVLILMAALEKNPWLVLPFGVSFVVFAWALVAMPVEPDSGTSEEIGLAPVWLFLGVAVVLGIAMPAPLVGWFTSVAAALR